MIRDILMQKISPASTLIIVVAFLLSGCGFQPLMVQHGPNGAVNDLARIHVLMIAERSGQLLYNFLRDDLAPRSEPQAPLYALEVRLQEPRQEIAIRRDESASRIAYTANATFFLRDSQGKTIFTGTSTSSSTFEAVNSEFASISGQRNARDRAMQEISADIRQQLAAYFNRRRSGS